MSDPSRQTTRWGDRPITRSDALMVVGVWGLLDLAKAALGAEVTLAAVAVGLLCLAWVWWRLPA